MRRIVPLFLCVVLAFPALAQERTADDNVEITSSIKEFRFIKGNAANPVQVREESKKLYTCKSYRTEFTFAEFYNPMETLDNVDIRVNDSRKHGILPRYEYYNSAGIFYSDAHVCYFQLPLLKKGSISEVDYQKTTLDPKYFTSIYFAEPQPVAMQEVKITVPAWMKLELKEYNFAGFNIKKEVKESGDETIYTYSMKDIPALKKEADSPGPTYYTPHLLVLCKSAQPKEEKIVYFSTLKDQYDWYHSLVSQVGNDRQFIKENTTPIIANAGTEEEKVKRIYQWVQDNIRYIAFENGIAGFKPEKAQDVMRKKYGDCKGMANLLTEMLLSVNIDARRCWIGTNHIAYDYSTPSLSVDNHMIAAWMNKGKPVFLDATEKYIGLGEIAERIQGRQTLIENGAEYILYQVPVSSPLQNTATETRILSVDGNDLKGHVVQFWKGENKEWLLSQLNDIKQNKQEDALKQYLAEGKQNYMISNFKTDNLSDYNADLKVEYDVLWKGVITAFDKEFYLDADNRRSFEHFKINAAERKLPYIFHFKNDLVFESEIMIPADKIVSELPEKLSIQQPGYSFTAGYTNTNGKIKYKNEIILKQTELSPADFNQWNSDIDKLTDFYSRQIVFKAKN